MLRLLALAAAIALSPAAAVASNCYAFVQGVPGVAYAALDDLRLANGEGEVSITYVGHSAFRIETPAGVSIVTDYFGSHGEGDPPTVVTMNKAHETHFTSNPHPDIEHVLKGWGPEPGVPIAHQLAVGDVTIRNVTTDIRGWGEPEKDGNSIFVFEVADLCIAHLGHLHHVPSEAQYALLGRIDIVMAAVDGTWTLPIDDMVEVLQTLKSRIVLPMHAFGPTSMKRFVEGMQPEFEFRVHDGDTLTVSLETLPAKPTVVLLGNRVSPSWFD